MDCIIIPQNRHAVDNPRNRRIANVCRLSFGLGGWAQEPLGASKSHFSGVCGIQLQPPEYCSFHLPAVCYALFEDFQPIRRQTRIHEK